MIVLGKEKKMPESMLEMVDSLIEEGKRGELKFCGTFEGGLNPPQCSYRLDGNACFIGKFVPDDMENLEKECGVQHMIESHGWGSHFSRFDGLFLRDLQVIHDCWCTRDPAIMEADPAMQVDEAGQSAYFLEELGELRVKVEEGVYDEG
jgi:hypothetical protein